MTNGQRAIDQKGRWGMHPVDDKRKFGTPGKSAGINSLVSKVDFNTKTAPRLHCFFTSIPRRNTILINIEKNYGHRKCFQSVFKVRFLSCCTYIIYTIILYIDCRYAHLASSSNIRRLFCCYCVCL